MKNKILTIYNILLIILKRQGIFSLFENALPFYVIFSPVLYNHYIDFYTSNCRIQNWGDLPRIPSYSFGRKVLIFILPEKFFVFIEIFIYV